MKKHRTLIEGPEWHESRRAVISDARRFDEAFRYWAYNIATEPRTNTTPFLTDDYRILISPISLEADLWIYFRMEPGDDACTLLWLQINRHGNLALRL